MGTGILFRM